MIRDVREKEYVKFKCQSSDCNNLAFFRYDADVCIKGRITRYVLCQDNTIKTLTENAKFCHILLQFPSTQPQQLHKLQDLINYYTFNPLSIDQQYTINGEIIGTVVNEQIKFIKPSKFLSLLFLTLGSFLILMMMTM